jgi:beta-glucosidase
MLREVDFVGLEPLDVPDEYINEMHVETPAPTCAPGFTHVTAFIVASRIFHQAMREVMFNDGCNCGYGRTLEEKLSSLQSLFHELKYALDHLPPKMRQWSVGDIYGPVTLERGQGMERPVTGRDLRDGDNTRLSEAEVAHARDEISRANIHVTHLWFQSYVLDQMDEVVQEIDAAGGQDSATPGWATARLEANWRDREDVCRQLLHVVHSIQHVHLEPNGNYLVSVRGSVTTIPSQADAVFRHIRSALSPPRSSTAPLRSTRT